MGKYRSESARLKNWDYRSNAAYFITICTQNREHYFGEIENSRMQISPVGAIAHVLWYEIKNHAKKIELGEFVVMPNHLHGILILNGNDVADIGRGVAVGRDVAYNVPTTKPTNETIIPKNEKMSAISPKSHSVSTIVRSYKSAVTKHCHRLGLEFTWQTRFHDHIIRNENSFHKISAYIKNNPMKWSDDQFFK